MRLHLDLTASQASRFITELAAESAQAFVPQVSSELHNISTVTNNCPAR